MAEAQMRHYIEHPGLDAKVISRGLAAPVGRSPHPYAAEVAARHGIPLPPEKKAAAVSGADMSMAMAIFVMDSDHRREVQQRFPTAAGKTFLLGQWSNEEIADPINETRAVFEQVWMQCEKGVKEWIQRLREAGMLRAVTSA